MAVRLDTFSLPGLPGLHSFAFATHEGEWLLIGGRQDGMHPKFGGFGNVQITDVKTDTRRGGKTFVLNIRLEDD